MNHKKILSILLGLSIIGFGIGIVLTDMNKYGICREGYTYLLGRGDDITDPSNTGCLDPIEGAVGQPIGVGAMALGIVSIILLFLSKPYFTAWLKFAVWFVPLAILWVFTSSTGGSSGMGLSMSFDRELATFWSSGLFITVSLLIIIIKAVNLRLDKKNSYSNKI